jgi:hypothetical protein
MFGLCRDFCGQLSQGKASLLAGKISGRLNKRVSSHTFAARQYADAISHFPLGVDGLRCLRLLI